VRLYLNDLDLTRKKMITRCRAGRRQWTGERQEETDKIAEICFLWYTALRHKVLQQKDNYDYQEQIMLWMPSP